MFPTLAPVPLLAGGFVHARRLAVYAVEAIARPFAGREESPGSTEQNAG